MSKLTVDKLNANEPIYVKNKTNGDFLIPIRSMEGGSELVPIPRTSIPIMVTNFAEGILFKKSSDFRKAVAKGYLELIPEKEAIEELETEEAVMELERLRRSEFTNLVYETAKVSPMEALQEVGVETISPKVKDILLRTDMTEDDKFAMLINEHKMGTMKKDDYEFLITTLGEKTKISRWASKALLNLKNNLFR